MKKIGMLGGMSWESTRLYYDMMNRRVKEKLGGLHSARIILSSVDFAPIEQSLKQGDWQNISNILGAEARNCEIAGAEGLMICTNTMHQLYDDIVANINIPIFHIADSLGKALHAQNIHKIGLLGTQFTMLGDFYHQRLRNKFGIDTIIPDKQAITIIDDIIFKELCLGIINPTSKQQYIDIINDLKNNGAQAIALACTEIVLLITQNDVDLPIFDTTEIHAHDAVDWALAH